MQNRAIIKSRRNLAKCWYLLQQIDLSTPLRSTKSMSSPCILIRSCNCKTQEDVTVLSRGGQFDKYLTAEFADILLLDLQRPEPLRVARFCILKFRWRCATKRVYRDYPVSRTPGNVSETLRATWSDRVFDSPTCLSGLRVCGEMENVTANIETSLFKFIRFKDICEWNTEIRQWTQC